MSTEARFLVKIKSITTVGLVDCFFKNLKKENDELELYIPSSTSKE